MQAQVLTSLKRITKSKIFVILCVFVFLGVQISQAQSLRSKRSLKRAKPEIEFVEPSEFDVKIGYVVAVSENNAVVKIRNYQSIPQWTSIFYACDYSMTAVAILDATDLKNKSCALFKVKSGTVAEGDIIFLKQIPPNTK